MELSELKDELRSYYLSKTDEEITREVEVFTTTLEVAREVLQMRTGEPQTITDAETMDVQSLLESEIGQIQGILNESQQVEKAKAFIKADMDRARRVLAEMKTRRA